MKASHLRLEAERPPLAKSLKADDAAEGARLV